MFGYRRAEIVGKPGFPLSSEGRSAETLATLAKVRAGQRVEDLEADLVRKDGNEFPVSVSISPIRDEDGEITGLSAILRDVTQQRRALAVAEHLAAIVNFSDDAIIGNTLDGIITSWNPAAEKMFGYSGDEIIGTSARRLISAGRTREYADLVAKVSVREPVKRLYTDRVRKDGEVFPVSLTVSPICDPDGAVVGASVICRDILEQRRAFDAARAMIESSLDSLVSISPEGMITDVNEATVKVTGVPRDQLIGTSFSDYFTDPAKAEEICQRVSTDGMAVDYPLTLRHRDGHATLTDVHCSASVYRDTAGNVLGVFAAARDVTEQIAGTEGSS
ncbi:MAG TPA: PAS domain S-box protein, partial [Dermatophilaceae bacterium]